MEGVEHGRREKGYPVGRVRKDEGVLRQARRLKRQQRSDLDSLFTEKVTHNLRIRLQAIHLIT
jgi:hypothetical protein